MTVTAWGVVQFIVNANNQLWPGLFNLLGHGCRAVVTVVSALSSAIGEILYYICDFFVEVVGALCGLGKAVVKLGWLICHVGYLLGVAAWHMFLGEWGILTVIYTLADGTISWLVNAFIYFGRYLSSATSDVRASISDAGISSKAFAVKYADETLEAIGNLGKAVCMTVGEKIVDGAKYIYRICENSVEKVGYFINASVWGIIHSIYDWTNAFGVLLRTALTAVYQAISLDVYCALLVIILILIASRMVFHHLSKQGLTFPFFNNGRRQPNTREPGYYFSDSSDDGETDNEEEEEQESEMEENVESDEENGEFDYDHQTELSDEDFDETEVEEFEVASDSDDSTESDATSIVVLLPEGAGRYNLRHRNSITPEAVGSKLSPRDLEKTLETERDKRMCVVCQDQPKSVLVLPCKHMCLCVDCAHEIVSSRNYARRVCPLCRSRITQVMDVFV